MLTLITVSIFIAVAMLTTIVLYPLLSRRTVIEDRLRALAPEQPLRRPTLASEQSPCQRLLSSLGQALPLKPREHGKYTAMLQAAGLRKETLPIFLGSKIALAVLLPGLFILFYTFPSGSMLRPDNLLFTVALAISGFLLPSFWLSRRVTARKREIFHTLPDVLDLLTICVEAGLGLDAALMKASENQQFKGNPLADELKQVGMETRAGKPRSEALKDMADRTMVDDVRAFVTMLSQTERFGTSLSLALRVYADALRTKRRQIAEEAAAKTAIKMLFPLAFFVFPALLVVMLGPAFFKFQDVFR